MIGRYDLCVVTVVAIVLSTLLVPPRSGSLSVGVGFVGDAADDRVIELSGDSLVSVRCESQSVSDLIATSSGCDEFKVGTEHANHQSRISWIATRPEMKCQVFSNYSLEKTMMDFGVLLPGTRSCTHSCLSLRQWSLTCSAPVAASQGPTAHDNDRICAPSSVRRLSSVGPRFGRLIVYNLWQKWLSRVAQAVEDG